MANKHHPAVTVWQCDGCLTEKTIEGMGQNTKAHLVPEDWGQFAASMPKEGIANIYFSLDLCGECIKAFKNEFADWKERRRPWSLTKAQEQELDDERSDKVEAELEIGEYEPASSTTIECYLGHKYAAYCAKLAPDLEPLSFENWIRKAVE